jgi:hypothetical protein
MSETLKDQLLREELAAFSRGPEPPRITPRSLELIESASRRPRPDSRAQAWAAGYGRSEPVRGDGWVARCEGLMTAAALTTESLAAAAGIGVERLRGLFAGEAFTQSEMVRLATALRVPVASLLQPDPVVPPPAMAYLNPRPRS